MIRLHVIPDRLRVSGVCYLVLQISMNNAMRLVLTRVPHYIRCHTSDDSRDPRRYISFHVQLSQGSHPANIHIRRGYGINIVINMRLFETICLIQKCLVNHLTLTSCMYIECVQLGHESPCTYCRREDGAGLGSSGCRCLDPGSCKDRNLKVC
jgi:hypothetical protein